FAHAARPQLGEDLVRPQARERQTHGGQASGIQDHGRWRFALLYGGVRKTEKENPRPRRGRRCLALAQPARRVLIDNAGPGGTMLGRNWQPLSKGQAPCTAGSWRPFSWVWRSWASPRPTPRASARTRP